MEIEQRIFGFSDPHPNRWKQRIIAKAVLLHSLGKLTPELVQQLQQEYTTWQAEKAAQKATLNG
jgi:hypothetical protein